MWETIKKILQNSKGACIIVEDNKPMYVITSFEDYQKLFAKSSSQAEEKEITKLNREINEWQEAQIEEKAKEILPEEEPRIEDIPL